MIDLSLSTYLRYAIRGARLLQADGAAASGEQRHMPLVGLEELTAGAKIKIHVPRDTISWRRHVLQRMNRVEDATAGVRAAFALCSETAAGGERAEGEGEGEGEAGAKDKTKAKATLGKQARRDKKKDKLEALQHRREDLEAAYLELAVASSAPFLDFVSALKEKSERG